MTAVPASPPFPDKAWSEARVLVTGACGSIGSELVRMLLEDLAVGELVCLDHNETELFLLEQRFERFPGARFLLADVRNEQELAPLFRGIDIVFHAAAYKHVVLCERSPQEAIQTNILGTQNVTRAAAHAQVRRVVYTSSDKAVNPTNVMGTSKLMGERLMTAANTAFGDGGPVCSSVRFGNVLGSRGSVVPIFREQIRNGGPVTLTDPEMTRFIMSIRDAASLVLDSVSVCRGGEVFITKMPVARIDQLAEVMIEALAPRHGRAPSQIEVAIIGRKPGEKMFEELMTSEEVRRTVELKNYFAVVAPDREKDAAYIAGYPDLISTSVSRPYVSSDEMPLDKTALHQLLEVNGLLGDEPDRPYHPDHRYWPAPHDPEGAA